MSVVKVTIFSLSCIFSLALSEWYVLGPQITNWTNAKAYCEQINTTLAAIHSESDFDEAIALCNGTDGCWIGLNDIDSEGEWEWDDGSITDYGFENNSNTNPTTGEYPWSTDRDPDIFGLPGEDCVQLNKDTYTWSDERCSMEFLPMCNDIDSPTSTYPAKSVEDTQNPPNASIAMSTTPISDNNDEENSISEFLILTLIIIGVVLLILIIIVNKMSKRYRVYAQKQTAMKIGDRVNSESPISVTETEMQCLEQMVSEYKHLQKPSHDGLDNMRKHIITHQALHVDNEINEIHLCNRNRSNESSDIISHNTPGGDQGEHEKDDSTIKPRKDVDGGEESPNRNLSAADSMYINVRISEVMDGTNTNTLRVSSIRRSEYSLKKFNSNDSMLVHRHSANNMENMRLAGIEEDNVDDTFERELNRLSNSHESMYVTKSTKRGTMVSVDEVVTKGETLDEYDEECDFEIIENILKKCDKKDWEGYLDNFKKEKLSDRRLKRMRTSDKMWEKLIPEYGVRIEFKDLWDQINNVV